MKIQRALFAGRELAGYKLGSSARPSAQMGQDAPVYGRVATEMVVSRKRRHASTR